VLIAFIRPRTVVFVSLLVSQLLVSLAHQPPPYNHYIYAAVQPCLALLASIIVVTAPLRASYLSTKGIATAFESPDPKLRSPEDNLTLWQWMTVSWLAPLLSLGKRRQLSEDDVWFLGYEFHHQNLHSAFCALYGSVIRRLLVANSLDLIVTSLLGLVELASSKWQAHDGRNLTLNR
jgi:hypothetical protein